MEGALYDTGERRGTEFWMWISADVNTSDLCSPQTKNVRILSSSARKQALAISFHLTCQVVGACL